MSPIPTAPGWPAELRTCATATLHLATLEAAMPPPPGILDNTRGTGSSPAPSAPRPRP